MVRSNNLAASLSLAVGVIERQFIARAVLLLRSHVDPARAEYRRANRCVDTWPKRSKSASTAGRSGGFFEKRGGFLSDVFERQAMAVIGIENEAVGFLGGLEGVA
jgi:hypothetical protein